MLRSGHDLRRSLIPVPPALIAERAPPESRQRGTEEVKFVALAATLLLAGCATLRQVAALRSVDFHLDRIAEVTLAGVDLSSVRTPEDLSFADAARVTRAVTEGTLPLGFRLHVTAENPADNTVTARLIGMSWTLFLEGNETVSGTLEREYRLPPGEPRDIPLDVELDLLEFFDRSGPDLIDLALNLAGAGGSPKQVTLRAVPTVETAIGPISYPQPITIVSRRVGTE